MPKIDAGRKGHFLDRVFHTHDFVRAHPMGEHERRVAKARIAAGDVGAGVGLS